MASTTDLGKWMLTNGGEYNPETAYEQLTMVMYENSTYITLKTVQGITPTDDHVNYQLMAKGFNPTALASVQAEDTSGVLGEAGGTVSAQDLVDWVVDQAANKLLKLTDLVSVQTNDATKGVSAALAYAMNQKIEQTNSNLDNRIGVGEKFTSGTLLNIIKQMSDGIHMALLTETVSDIPFSDTENYIIVFKGTSYGDAYTRIMAFPMSQSSAPKWGMVFWNGSRIVWV